MSRTKSDNTLGENITVRVSKETEKFLREQAAGKTIGVSTHIRTILEEYRQAQQ